MHQPIHNSKLRSCLLTLNTFAFLCEVTFRSLVGRPRNRKDADFVLIGNQLIEGDLFAHQKLKVRGPWDQTILTQFDLMEYLLDYTFHNLGQVSPGVIHPILLSEPLGNPNYCRGKMNELLFECYDVPAVATAIPEVLAWRYHQHRQSKSASSAVVSSGSEDMEDDQRDTAKDGDCTGDGLIISCGYESSTIIPMLSNAVQFAHASRLSIGGSHLSSYLTHSLATVQAQAHERQWNAERLQEVVERYGWTAAPNTAAAVGGAAASGHGYRETLDEMAKLYDINGHTVPHVLPLESTVPEPLVLQLPLSAKSSAALATSSQDLQAKAFKKEQQRARLRALMQERKEKKLLEDQEILKDWDAVRAAFYSKELSPSEYLRQLKRRTFADESDFLAHYEKLKKSVEQRLKGPFERSTQERSSALATQAFTPFCSVFPLFLRR